MFSFILSKFLQAYFSHMQRLKSCRFHPGAPQINSWEDTPLFFPPLLLMSWGTFRLGMETMVKQVKKPMGNGVDVISADALKNSGHGIQSCLIALTSEIWNNKQFSGDLENALNMTILKDGDQYNYSNCRGIAFLL